MKNLENNAPISLVEDAKITREKLNNWTGDIGLEAAWWVNRYF